MKFEISHFSLYDLNDFFLHIVKLFRYLSVSCLLSMLMVAPAYAQFTLLPSTSKTIEECNSPGSVFSQFLLTGDFPSTSDTNQAQDFLNNQNQLNDTKSALDSALKESQDATNKFNDISSKLKYAQQIYSDCVKTGKACGAEQSVVGDISKQQDVLMGPVNQSNENYNKAQDAYNKLIVGKQDVLGGTDSELKDKANAREDILACAIKTGRASLSLIPYFITYIINFALGLVGLISVLFIVIGGYRYVVGGLGEDKEKGKKTIRSALMGMGLALLAWSIVNIILKAITG